MSTHATRAQRAALEELEELHSCLLAVYDLVSPDGHLQFKERDHIAILLGRLLREQEAAHEALRAAVHAEREGER
ncbi:MAG: hypothetical protein GXC76_01865 [Rhodanobacteraceae bacterium]|jgi:hypothetical protein|nr:hypothetical protein [Rhodanobacteraceae bacterium]